MLDEVPSPMLRAREGASMHVRKREQCVLHATRMPREMTASLSICRSGHGKIFLNLCQWLVKASGRIQYAKVFLRLAPITGVGAMQNSCSEEGGAAGRFWVAHSKMQGALSPVPGHISKRGLEGVWRCFCVSASRRAADA